MGVAAYNRGSSVISKGQEGRTSRPTAFEIIDRMNALPKSQDASCLLVESALIQVDPHHSVTWLMDADGPFGKFSLHYRSMSVLMRSWNIALVDYDEATEMWRAIQVAPDETGNSKNF